MGRPTKQKGKGKKAPFLKQGPQPDPPNPDEQPPAFSFEKMQDGSGNSFNCCEDDDRLSGRLHDYGLPSVSYGNVFLEGREAFNPRHPACAWYLVDQRCEYRHAARSCRRMQNPPVIFRFKARDQFIMIDFTGIIRVIFV